MSCRGGSMFGRACRARGSVSPREFSAAGLCMFPIGEEEFKILRSSGSSTLTRERGVESNYNECLSWIQPPLTSSHFCLTSDSTRVSRFIIYFSLVRSCRFLLHSSRCSQHTLEADSVLPGGLLNSQEGGGDLWQHRCQAQREERGKTDKKPERILSPIREIKTILN